MMQTKEKELIQKFLKAKEIISQQKLIISDIQDDVINIVKKYAGDDKNDSLVFDDKKISISVRKKYIYPKYVDEALDKVKELKTKSEQLGDGIYEEITSIRVGNNNES